MWDYDTLSLPSVSYIPAVTISAEFRIYWDELWAIIINVGGTYTSVTLSPFFYDVYIVLKL